MMRTVLPALLGLVLLAGPAVRANEASALVQRGPLTGMAVYPDDLKSGSDAFEGEMFANVAGDDRDAIASGDRVMMVDALSDAARTLLGLDRLWQTDRAAGSSVDELSAFAARFGSDVPFFVHA